MSIQAIETSYNGYRFRSRLEARWAVCLDILEVKYEYEKEGFQLSTVTYENKYGFKSVIVGDVYYLPDFYLPEQDVWLEIKGDVCSEEDEAKALMLNKSSGKGVYIAQGSIGDHKWILPTREELDGFTLPVTVEQTSALALAFDPQDDDTVSPEGWGMPIHCPVCGHDYVHYGNVSEKWCDDYSVWEGRGGAVRVGMWCENGHEWTFRFGFHKGATHLAIENVSTTTFDPGLWLAKGNENLLTAAITTARAARFEHGEKPKVPRGKPKK